jgi:hypothetical protein
MRRSPHEIVGRFCETPLYGSASDTDALQIIYRSVGDRLCWRFAQFQLVAHFLETRSERFNLLLLLGDDPFLLRRTRL